MPEDPASKRLSSESKQALFAESTESFLARAWRQEDARPDDVWQAKRDLAAVVHELVCATSKSDAEVEVLRAVTAAVKAQLDTLQTAPARSFHDAFADGSYYRDPQRYTDRVFIVGASNPAVPQMALTFDGEAATGVITYDESCVGAPGWAHGGLVATAFDQAMGYRLICEGLPVVTGQLTVDYLRPTPLGKKVTYRATIAEVVERRVQMRATAHIDGKEIGRAKAVFVIIPKGSWKL